MNEYLSEFHKAKGDAMDHGYRSRYDLVRKYAWAVPTPQALSRVAEFSPILEVGAGTGYWAYLLQQQGADVLPVDKWPPGTGRNRYSHYQEWTDIHPGDEFTVESHTDRTLFLCWPPYDNDFASRCVRNYQGEHVIYIGESYGGCNATDEFFWLVNGDAPSHIVKNDGDYEWMDGDEGAAYAKEQWGPQLYEEIDMLNLPQWWGIHDYLHIYRRKDNNVQQHRADSGSPYR
jgi:hypothetical protein